MRHYSPQIEIKKGLRPQENTKAAEVYLVKAEGVLNVDGALHSIEEPTLLSFTDTVLQAFQLKSYRVVITTTGFYEFRSGVWTLVLSLASAGRWGVADYGEFIIFASPDQVIARDPLSGVYSPRTDVPAGFDIINFNGQCVVIGCNVL